MAWKWSNVENQKISLLKTHVTIFHDGRPYHIETSPLLYKSMDWFKYARDLRYFFISKLFNSKPELSKKCSILKNVENEKKKKKEKEVATGGVL